MKSAVENLEPTRVKITVEAPYEELKGAIDAAYREVSSQVSIKGFRKGHVPARIIDQRVGRGVVIEQAVNSVLPELYRNAVAETEVKPLGQPEISVTEVPAMEGPLGGQLAFTAEVDVRPEIAIPAMSTVTVTVDSANVDDATVDERLTALRERFSSLKTVSRKAKDGDFVVIDMTASIDGDEVESVSGVSYQVGSNSMIEGLDTALVGLEAGKEKSFTSTLAGGEHEGKDADVVVTVTEVKERELPEADDEFAQLASEFDTIDELREDLRSSAAADIAQNQAGEAQTKLIEYLRETVDFPLPQGVIDAEVASHLEREGKEADDPHGDEVRESTTEMLRDQLLLDVLVEQYQVQVGQEELLQFLFQTAQQYGVDPSQFIQAADQNGQIPVFVGEVARNKALAHALRHANVVDSDGNAVDLSEFIGTDTEEEAARAAEVEEAAKAAPKKQAAKKPAAKKPAAKKTDDAERTDDAEAAEEKAPAKKPATRKTAAKKAEDAEAAEEKAPAKKPATRKTAAKKAEDAESTEA